MLEALGVNKNTWGVSDIAKRVTTIPDLPIGASHGVTDIKHVRDLAFSEQLQAQVRAALTAKRPFNLIVGTNARTISRPLADAIDATGGRIFMFDEKTRKFRNVVLEGNKVIAK